MATRAANKRLNREYKSISQNPPPYITARPSEANILEWHYILTGPPDTPYQDGQYWGTLIFPSNYPFAPPAIRMHTPSGRFQPSTRLCLSISDFHPKSFNPAWEVSTILIGLLSFMTSEEMTTGSVSATETERKLIAGRTRWWNSTGGGSWKDTKICLRGNIKVGDGGFKFRTEWPQLDQDNWAWMRENKIDPLTGNKLIDLASTSLTCGSGLVGLRCSTSQAMTDAVVGSGRAVVEGQSWISSNKLVTAGFCIFIYVLLVRLLRDGANKFE